MNESEPLLRRPKPVLSKRDQIEKYTRPKNRVYLKWRAKWDFGELEVFCAECLLRYGALPNWEEYIQARRRQDWQHAEAVEVTHREWRAKLREWCLERGITTYSNQSAQFVKFYFSWYRYEWESRHGKITRKYGRQMF